MIELLVVISIKALMFSILLPALQGARTASKRIACLSNTRQSAIAMTAYAVDEDSKYPNLPNSPSQRSWGSYAMVQGGNVIGFGLLYKGDYIKGLRTLLYCPGRDPGSWPASYLLNGTPATVVGGKIYPNAHCYVMRGWEPATPATHPFGKGQAGWAIPNDGREAITSDIMLNWSYATAAHGIGLNIGYSDGSAGEVRFDTPRPDSGNTFLETLTSWQTTPTRPSTPTVTTRRIEF